MALNKNTYIDFRLGTPQCRTDAVGQIGVVTDAGINSHQIGASTLQSYNDTANALIIGTLLNDANLNTGMEVPSDAADNNGGEFYGTAIADAAMPMAFKVGTVGAFQFSLTFGMPVVADYDVCLLGFRKVAAAADIATAAATLTAYSDLFALNIDNGAIKVTERLNSGTGVTTDTTDTLANDTEVTLKCLVSSAGVCTATIDGAAPTATSTFTFDDGDIVTPFWHYTKDAAGSASPPIVRIWHSGLQ
jgi:hypothetical protein